MQVALADPEAARMAVEVERVADDTGWQRKPGRQPISRGPMAFRLEGEGAEAKAALASGCGGVIQDGAVTLEDADTISSALNTTLGYMCGNAYTDYMLDQTKMMRDYFARNVDRRDLYFEAMAADRSREKEILDYLDEILDSVDSLHKRT